jgi:hypothetical protein
VIDVSAHGVDRRERAEPRKYVRAANIPGMDDGIAAGKRRERLRPQQAMGIGNRANGSPHARPDYKRSRVHLHDPAYRNAIGQHVVKFFGQRYPNIELG